MTNPAEELTFEFEEPRQEECSCCGAPRLVLVRFVYRGGDAYAVYKAWLSLGGHERVADMLVVFGEWGDDGSIDDRVEFRLNLWCSEDHWNVSVADHAPATAQSGQLGKQLDREEALTHPWIQDVFDLSDEIVLHDQPLIDYLTDRPTLQ